LPHSGQNFDPVDAVPQAKQMAAPLTATPSLLAAWVLPAGDCEAALVTGLLAVSERSGLATNQHPNARITTRIAIPTSQSCAESAVLATFAMKGTSITRTKMIPRISFFMQPPHRRLQYLRPALGTKLGTTFELRTALGARFFPLERLAAFGAKLGSRRLGAASRTHGKCHSCDGRAGLWRGFDLAGDISGTRAVESGQPPADEQGRGEKTHADQPVRG
jgi:hypothetical protein